MSSWSWPAALRALASSRQPKSGDVVMLRNQRSDIENRAPRLWAETGCGASGSRRRQSHGCPLPAQHENPIFAQGDVAARINLTAPAAATSCSTHWRGSNRHEQRSDR
jgi:hypothetical protein